MIHRNLDGKYERKIPGGIKMHLYRSISKEPVTNSRERVNKLKLQVTTLTLT